MYNISCNFSGCDDPLFLDFIQRCLDWDPEARMTPSAALRHAWLRRRLPRPPNEKEQSSSPGVVRSTPTGPRTPKSTGATTTNALFTSNRVQVDDRSSTLHSGKLPPVT